MTTDEKINEIARLEAERCRALVERDFASLQALVAHDLVHVHANGQVDDRQAYLEGLEKRFRFLRVVRRDLKVRVYDDVAVATGLLDQLIEIQATRQQLDVKFTTTQVWVRRENHWAQVSFQATTAA